MLFLVLGSQTPTSAGSRPLKATKKDKGAASKTSKTTKVKNYHRTDEQISLQLETYRSVELKAVNFYDKRKNISFFCLQKRLDKGKGKMKRFCECSAKPVPIFSNLSPPLNQTKQC